MVQMLSVAHLVAGGTDRTWHAHASGHSSRPLASCAQVCKKEGKENLS